MGNSDADRNSLRRVRKDYRALGEPIRDFEAQVGFLSILLVKRKGFKRASWIWKINKWV